MTRPQKQDAKIMRDLAALDRESHKDVLIPVPVRHRDNAGRVSHGNKITPGVRKILLSQKTFANHLADYEALSAIAGPSQSAPAVRPAPSSTSSTPKPSVRSHKKKDQNASPAPTPLRRVSNISKSSPVKTEAEDTPMIDVPSLSLGTATVPPAHPRDNDPLLVSRVPQLPSQAELDALLAAPALSYNEARGSWVDEDRRKPVRVFCEVCGYWGRVKCGRCGGKLCALECLQVHQEECFTRYGA